ncbi:hypothetical protein PHLGIDRAFT_60592, partial [Phlebiopsis gigantea 11061_1 CR5-6]
DDSTLTELIEQLKSGMYKVEDEKQKECFRLLSDIDFVASRVEGSVTNRRRMRNEIWSLMYSLGSPSWFITFAPADVNHPVAIYFAEKDEYYYPDVADKDHRYKLIASNPVAGAKFFKLITEAFINHVLGYEHNRRGVYGETSGYYGTVEQ